MLVEMRKFVICIGFSNIFVQISASVLYTRGMNKRELRDAMEKRIAELDHLIGYIEKNPVKGADGTLLCCATGNEVYFYRRFDDGRREFLGRDRSELVRQLARKQHYARMLEVAGRERAQIVKCLGVLGSGRGMADIDEVYPSLHRAVRAIEPPFTLTDDGNANVWLRKNRFTQDMKLMSGQNKTLRGEFVRSKSEVIIADRLTYYGVPYVYETTTMMSEWEEFRRPDFFILNKRTRKEFYWEHLGMMGDPRYAASNQQKIEKFAKNGIVLGKNLILSFECSERPLSTEYVDQLIKETLI